MIGDDVATTFGHNYRYVQVPPVVPDHLPDSNRLLPVDVQ